MRSSSWLWQFWLASVCFAATQLSLLAAETAEPAAKTNADAKWNIETAAGPQFDQPIDTQDGTWLSVDVSPDGQQVAFDLLGDLYLMPITGADGTHGQFPRKLTEGVAWDMQPRFSPDGQTIAFTSDRTGKSERAGDNIWTLPVAGGNARQVTNETFRLLNGASWSPDGNYLVARKHFSGRRSLGAGEIWLYHRSAEAAQAMTGVQLTSRPNDQKDVNEPVYSPDGRFLYYSQDATPGDTFEYDKDSNKQIYVIKRLDLTTGETIDYVTGAGGACRPTPSRNGQHLAFVRRIAGRTGLFVMDIQSGAVRLVYDQLERDMQEAWAIHGVYPSFNWTPDDSRIVVWAHGKIRSIQVSDGTATVIPFHVRDQRRMTQRVRTAIEVAPANFPVRMLRHATPAPDGKQVAFQALGYIYVRDLPDGQPRRLTRQTEHFEFFPSYSRDGRYVAYATWNDESLGSIRVASTQQGDGQESWKVTDQPGHYLEPVFSPAGQQIVYVKSAGGHLTSALWSRDPGLYSVPVHGGTSHRIHKSGTAPQFAASDDRVFFSDSRPGKDADNLGLFSIGIDGQELRQHFNSQWATEYRISPDGQWIAFIERFHVYLAPFITTGQTIEIGPSSTALPTVKVSSAAGDSIQFAGDSQALHWVLGPTWYTTRLADACRALRKDEVSAPVNAPVNAPNSEVAASAGEMRLPTVSPLAISFTAAHAKPRSTIALVGGRLVTLGPAGIIEDGTIVIHENRIVAIGRRDEVTVPDGAQLVPIPGLVVLPGLIDVHAHGAQAEAGLTPQVNWVDYARLAFGITTIHDPSNDTGSIFAASEMIKAGLIVGPRTFSTGTILYGATGSYKAEIESLEDARFHLSRMQAVGAFSVKSYNQPRRDQRQQVVAAARELGMMVVPEGGSTFMHNLTMIVDGHTGIEHTLPVQTAYDDVFDLWRGTEVGYTPTLCVAYGGISGERYWYEVDDLFDHPRLNRFLPAHVLQPRSRRRQKAPLAEYNHIRVAEIARQVVADGGWVQAGGHGQLEGICTHWELWSFVQGGMTPLEALRCGSLYGAKYLGLDRDLGSLETGKLADLIVIARGFDPTREIRDSQQIELVMANGRLFAAATMEEIAGDKLPAPRFFFHSQPHSTGTALPRVRGCECTRPSGPLDWLRAAPSGE